MYVSKMLYPIWKYIHKGCPAPYPTPCRPGPPQTGPGGGEPPEPQWATAAAAGLGAVHRLGKERGGENWSGHT